MANIAAPPGTTISWAQLDGVEAYLGERKIKFQGPQPRPMMLRVIGKLGGYVPHPMIEHFKFVQSHTRRRRR